MTEILSHHNTPSDSSNPEDSSACSDRSAVLLKLSSFEAKLGRAKQTQGLHGPIDEPAYLALLDVFNAAGRLGRHLAGLLCIAGQEELRDAEAA